MSLPNPNQALIDQLKQAIKALDDAEAAIDAGVANLQKTVTDAQAAADAACAAAQKQVDDARAAVATAVAGYNAQKAAYETQEAALRAAVTALGG